MGLFGKSFEEQVKAALDAIRGKGLNVRHLDAQIEGKVVTLSGEVPSVDVKKRIMVEFNALVETENTLNRIRVEEPTTPTAVVGAAAKAAPAPVAPAVAKVEAPVAAEETVHIVEKGDTLSALAKKYYGKANLYMKIFNANKDQLTNPDVIKVGQKLRIPKL